MASLLPPMRDPLRALTFTLNPRSFHARATASATALSCSLSLTVRSNEPPETPASRRSAFAPSISAVVEISFDSESATSRKSFLAVRIGNTVGDESGCRLCVCNDTYDLLTVDRHRKRASYAGILEEIVFYVEIIGVRCKLIGDDRLLFTASRCASGMVPRYQILLFI